MKFGYTILYVKDVFATIEFYERAFELKRKFVHESGYGELETGSTTLAFASFELIDTHGFNYQKAAPEHAAPGFEIALVTVDVQNAYQKAISEGATDVKKPSQKPWGQSVGYVRDLNGFIVEICSPAEA